MGKALVIGIAGGTCSGKSTFTQTLENALSQYKIKVAHMDAYFKAPEDRPVSKAPITGKMYPDHNHPLTADLPKLERDLEDWVSSGEYEIVVVEGLMTLWDEKIFEMLDLKLFVDCRDDERAIRRVKRHMAWGQTFEEVTNIYLDLVRYRQDEYVLPTKWKADFILNGAHPSPVALEAVLAFIEKRLR